MGSGTAATEVIVVHAGKVVVNERVGVHHLDGAGGSEGIFARSSTGFGSGEGQDGAETFASGEDRVAHGLMDGPRRKRDLG